MQNFFLFAVIQYVKDHSKARHRYEVKIQKDMIFVPMPYYGISIGHIYNKKDTVLKSKLFVLKIVYFVYFIVF